MKQTKNTRKAIIITLVTSLILLIAITVAYFAIAVSNTNNEKINAASSTVSIVYTDCASSNQSDCANMTKNLALGESFEKTFKVRNTGTIPVDYKVIFKELTNTFQNGDLVYTIKDLNDTVLQSERPVPYAPSATTNVNALLDTVAAGATKEFKIVVKLKETTGDQTVNMNATYAIKLGITTQNGGTDRLYNLVADADPNSIDVITKTAPTGATCTNTFAYDGTSDNNLRFVGNNPCNYVSFNDEFITSTGSNFALIRKPSQFMHSIYTSMEDCQTAYEGYGSPSSYECIEYDYQKGGWRIIGIMNNVDDGTGKKETRLKIIRGSIGTYSWDSSDASINDGLGINDWTQADIMTELNGDYLDTTLTENPLWYDSQKNSKNKEFDRNMVLKQSAQNLIANAKWYLGAPTAQEQSNATPKDYYKIERSTQTFSTVASNCNDGYCPRSTEWTGKVALPYPSDYSFATSGSINISRNNCLEATQGTQWGKEEFTGCIQNDWLRALQHGYDWNITPNSSAIHGGINNRYLGISYRNPVASRMGMRPTVYLKSSVKITGGDGSLENPYTLG